MQHRPAAVLAALMIAAVSACTGAGAGASPSATPEGPDDLQGPWQLTSGSVDGREVPIVEGHRITLTLEGSDIFGTAACNGYGARLAASGGGVRVDEFGQTAMGCAPEVMASEEAYTAALNRVTEIGLDGDELVLGGPNVELRFDRLPTAPADALVDADWVLESLLMGDQDSPPAGEKATLRIESDGTIAGGTGCRAFTGRYVIRGDEFLATQLEAELVEACPAHFAEQDGHVLSVIGDGFSAELGDGRLTLSSMGAMGLAYRRR